MASTTHSEPLADISVDLPFGEEQVTMTASIHEPAGATRAVLVCWPGGSYDRRYWQFDAVPGYSFAEHMTAQGFAVVAADHLGVGASSAPADVDAVNLDAMARAAGALATALRQRLPGPPLLGAGHSLGGCITIIAQARRGPYDGVASLGFPHGAKDSVPADAADARDARAAAVTQAKAFFADW